MSLLFAVFNSLIVALVVADPNKCNLVAWGGNTCQWYPTDVCANYHYNINIDINSIIYECSTDKTYVTLKQYTDLDCKGQPSDSQNLTNSNTQNLNCDGFDCSLKVRIYSDCHNFTNYEDFIYVTGICENDMMDVDYTHYHYYICNETSYTQWYFSNHTNWNCDGMTANNSIIRNNATCNSTTNYYYDIIDCNYKPPK